MKLAALLFALLCALAPAARAEFLLHSTSAGPFPIGGSGSVALPQFDPALGVLRDIKINVRAGVTGTWSVENTNAQPTWVFGSGSGQYVGALVQTSLGVPGLNPAHVEHPSVQLAPFDGSLDFAGPSATTRTFTNSYGDGNPSFTWDLYTDAQIAPYVGTGTTSLGIAPITALGTNMPQGVASLHPVTVMIWIDVLYDYEPLPAKMCFAWSSSGCPCSNPATYGHGCGNSANAAGGTLDGAGSTSLASDAFVLSGSGMTNSSALYFQGTAFGYEQTPYGDGLRCVGGSLVRLGTKANVAGASQYPGPGDASVSVHGQIAAPGTRYYQVIYRDPADYCTPSAVNATSAFAVVWTP